MVKSYPERRRSRLLFRCLPTIGRRTLILINDANTQARWWMHLKDEWVNAGKERRPFVNPVQPKTVRFKS